MSCANQLLNRLVTCAATALLTGCAATTTMKLSGSSGSAFTGHYVFRGATNNVGGSIPVTIELRGAAFQACEFRKTKVEDTLILEIYHGAHQILRAPASAGTWGVKASGEGRDNWHFELLTTTPAATPP